MYNYLKYIFMKKENIIFRTQIVVFVLFCYFLFRVVCYVDEYSMSDVVFIGLFSAIYCALEFWRERLVEEKNPLSRKKVALVLETIADKRAGLKNEFIQNFSIEMYNLFLERGYIHELFAENGKDVEWQVTKLGLRRKVEICS